MSTFNLEQAIVTWRRFLGKERAISPDDADELEIHLRDEVDELIERGRTPERAFQEAVRHLGSYAQLHRDYHNVYWTKVREERRLTEELSIRIAMLKNYLTIAQRNLRKRPGFTLINISGLAVGLACCLLIGLYIANELSYDRFHSKLDRMYRLKFVNTAMGEQPDPGDYRVWGSAAIAPLMQTDFPEVETTVRLSGQHTILLRRGTLSFQEENYLYADSTFFDVFDFELLRGNPETVLAEPRSIVLTETAAQRYFGDEDPIGQTLRFGSNDDDDQFLYTVNGVMADTPANSHIQFDILLSMISFEQRAPDYMFNSWGYVDFFTYVLLRPEATPEEIQAKFPGFVQTYLGDGPQSQNPPRDFHLKLEPMEEAYLAPTAGRLLGPQGNPHNLYVFGVIGLFVLLIACINFTNLSTARSVERAREVGVRKAVGAERQALVRQFLTEAALMTLLATAIAFVVAYALLPAFNAFTGKAIPGQLLMHPWVLVTLLGGALVVGLLAGAYPAFVLSAYQPVQVLKGAFQSSRGGTRLRQTLVILQFSISIVLIAATLIVFQQLQFMQNETLGFEKEQQLVLDFGGDGAVLQQRRAIIDALTRVSGVEEVSAARSVPGGYRPGAGTTIESPTGDMVQGVPYLFEVDFGFIEQLDLAFVAGRPFNPAFASDSTEALIINEATARRYGYADPTAALGKRFEQWGRSGEIIGVIKDFHHESLQKDISPLTFRWSPFVGQFLIKVNTENLPQTIAALETKWREVAPHRPYLYSFLDADFDALYHTERQFGSLFGVFAGLAIVIACLGLFGLATFTAQQRTKEVGVRKVLGASTAGLVRLLAMDFLKLVGIAFVAAVPLTYFGMQEWLNGFSYRTALGVEVFALAGIIAVLIAIITVAYQAIRAATSNPVDALRYE